jgi:hypothetical protein
MASDNIAGISGGILKRIYLFPGMVIQWAMYVSVGAKSYGQVREQTRLSRSPLMTFVYATMAWLAIACFLLGGFER